MESTKQKIETEKERKMKSKVPCNATETGSADKPLKETSSATPILDTGIHEEVIKSEDPNLGESFQIHHPSADRSARKSIYMLKKSPVSTNIALLSHDSKQLKKSQGQSCSNLNPRVSTGKVSGIDFSPLAMFAQGPSHINLASSSCDKIFISNSFDASMEESSTALCSKVEPSNESSNDSSVVEISLEEPAGSSSESAEEISTALSSKVESSDESSNDSSVIEISPEEPAGSSSGVAQKRKCEEKQIPETKLNMSSEDSNEVDILESSLEEVKCCQKSRPEAVQIYKKKRYSRSKEKTCSGACETNMDTSVEERNEVVILDQPPKEFSVIVLDDESNDTDGEMQFNNNLVSITLNEFLREHWKTIKDRFRYDFGTMVLDVFKEFDDGEERLTMTKIEFRSGERNIGDPIDSESGKDMPYISIPDLEDLDWSTIHFPGFPTGHGDGTGPSGSVSERGDGSGPSGSVSGRGDGAGPSGSVSGRGDGFGSVSGCGDGTGLVSWLETCDESGSHAAKASLISGNLVSKNTSESPDDTHESEDTGGHSGDSTDLKPFDKLEGPAAKIPRICDNPESEYMSKHFGNSGQLKTFDETSPTSRVRCNPELQDVLESSSHGLESESFEKWEEPAAKIPRISGSAIPDL